MLNAVLTMDYFTELGYLGLFVASFLAATILPLSSEVVLSALLLNGLSPVALITIATIGISIGTIAVTIMATTIAIIIVDTISGVTHRAPIIGVDTVHSIITRARPSGMSMIDTISRATELAAITDTTPIRSSLVIMTIGAYMRHRTVITGCMTMIAETRSLPQLPPAQSLDWSSVPWPIKASQPTESPENAHGLSSVGIFSGHRSIFYDD